MPRSRINLAIGVWQRFAMTLPWSASAAKDRHAALQTEKTQDETNSNLRSARSGRTSTDRVWARSRVLALGAAAAASPYYYGPIITNGYGPWYNYRPAPYAHYGGPVYYGPRIIGGTGSLLVPTCAGIVSPGAGSSARTD
jgi:hypothetical protein